VVTAQWCTFALCPRGLCEHWTALESGTRPQPSVCASAVSYRAAAPVVVARWAGTLCVEVCLIHGPRPSASGPAWASDGSTMPRCKSLTLHTSLDSDRPGHSSSPSVVTAVLCLHALLTSPSSCPLSTLPPGRCSCHSRPDPEGEPLTRSPPQAPRGGQCQQHNSGYTDQVTSLPHAIQKAAV